jgi:hypothetical protein
MIPTKIASCADLRIREDAVDPALRLFRLEGFGRKLVLRADLAEVLEAAGVTGSGFDDVNGFAGF